MNSNMQKRVWNACLCLWCRAVPHVFGCAILLRVTISPLSRWNWRTWQMHQSTSRECCSVYKNCNVTIKYHQSKEMLLVDDLSHYAHPYAWDIPLDIVINHEHTTPQKKEFQAAICNDPLLHNLTDTKSFLAVQKTYMMFNFPSDHTMSTVMS